MNSNFFEELGKVIETTIQKQTEKINKVEGIDEEEIELAQKLDAIEEYAIDRFEENMVILEDRKTGKMKNVTKDKIPEECHEGDILKYKPHNLSVIYPFPYKTLFLLPRTIEVFLLFIF